MDAQIFVGTSGWSYDAWKTGFYEGIPRKSWLEHIASQMNSVEVNASFYRLQRETTYEKWIGQVPEGFRFAVKGHRFVTHNKKLLDPVQGVINCRENAAPLGDRLDAVVWQLSAKLGKDLDRLVRFAGTLVEHWPQVRHSVEFRHPSWFDVEVAQVCSDHGIAVCLSDSGTWPMWQAVTADMVYVRLHGEPYTYASRYEDDAIAWWAHRCLDWRDEGRAVYVYFDNDAHGHAPYDAVRLLDAIERLDASEVLRTGST